MSQPMLCSSHTVRFMAFAFVLAGFAVAGAPVFADPLPKIEKKFENGGVLRFYGQINKGVLSFDDGLRTETYGLIDNNNANTRVGLTYSADIGDTWKYLGTLEIQYAPFSTTNTSILQQSPASGAYDLTNANIRKIDNQFTSDKYGVFYIGQGNMASQDSAEVDLSGTTVIAKSAVQEAAGGQLFREVDGTLSAVAVKNAFTNYNGLGRTVRLRYDTPAVSGFSLHASVGRNLLYTDSDPAKESAVQDQDLYDLALAYEGKSGDFKYQGQIAYGYKDAYTVGGAITPGTDILVGSASVLHGPTGLSLTAALGEQDNGKVTGNYAYLKAGWQADLVPLGKTAFAIDHYSSMEINGTDTDGTSTGFSVVQNVTNWNTELWATYRAYSYNAATKSYNDANAIFVGARFKF